MRGRPQGPEEPTNLLCCLVTDAPESLRFFIALDSAGVLAQRGNSCMIDDDSDPPALRWRVNAGVPLL